mmetsp:Transcript_9055/g.38369  ORF Transcript_9055/g.38369 Transcript_9055/m.38369 type:complete len:228 (+) Transcript_9055:1383-2066(+)
MSGLSMPIPNATVAATTFTAPVRKSMCVFARADGERRAWYASTLIALFTFKNLDLKVSRTCSVSRTDGQYTMTDPRAFKTASATVLKSVSAPLFLKQLIRKLERSQLFTATNGSVKRKTSMISLRTFPTAVAVSAIKGTSLFGDRKILSASRARYAARKSWPHCDTQCASSTAIKHSIFLSTISRRRETKYVGSRVVVACSFVARLCAFFAFSSSSSTKPTSFSGVT